MGYSLLLVPEVRDFLFNCPGLSRQDRVRLFNQLNTLREHGESYRGDATRRLTPGSEHFSFDILFPSNSGVLRHFRFVLSDASAN